MHLRVSRVWIEKFHLLWLREDFNSFCLPINADKRSIITTCDLWGFARKFCREKRRTKEKKNKNREIESRQSRHCWRVTQDFDFKETKLDKKSRRANFSNLTCDIKRSVSISKSLSVFEITKKWHLRFHKGDMTCTREDASVNRPFPVN